MPVDIEELRKDLSERNFSRSKQLLRNLFAAIIDGNVKGEILWHPLGFMNVKLGEEIGRRIRLHIWLPDTERHPHDLSIIHSHSWNLESFVLCGQMVNIFYDVVSERKKPSHRIYEVEYDGLVNTLVPTDETVRAFENKRETFKINTRYEVKLGEFHQTEVSRSNLTATIVFEEQVTHVRPKILKNLSTQGAYKVERQPCTINELKETLTKVIDHLES